MLAKISASPFPGPCQPLPDFQIHLSHHLQLQRQVRRLATSQPAPFCLSILIQKHSFSAASQLIWFAAHGYWIILSQEAEAQRERQKRKRRKMTSNNNGGSAGGGGSSMLSAKNFVKMLPFSNSGSTQVRSFKSTMASSATKITW